MTTIPNSVPSMPDGRRRAFDRRLDGIGWGLFLLMTGAIWLMPDEQVPPGTSLIGTGILLLGLNTVRYVKGRPIDVLTAALGALALAGGLADLGGVSLPLLAISLVIVGGIVLRRAVRKSPG